jgi:hypothetical protein
MNRFLGSNIARYAGAQLRDINSLPKTQNAEPRSKPGEMRIKIENPAVKNRHGLEQAVPEQKTAVGRGHASLFRSDDLAI